MIVKMVLLPSLLLIAGLALVAFAMLAPAREEAPVVSPRLRATVQATARTRAALEPAAERIRALELIARSGNRERLIAALDDPDPAVAGVAAILLRD